MTSPIKQRIANISLLVESYDDAIEFYTKKLSFELLEDSDMGAGKRWVLISPPNANGTNILLAKATNEQQSQAIGNQAGGRVFLFLQTNDFWRDYQQMKNQGVEFCEEPRVEEYGTVVVFKDLYGTKWDLLELKDSNF